MRNLLKLIAALVAFAGAAPANAQTPYPAINASARIVSAQLLVYAGCQKGNAPEVGIWPLQGDDLPIEDASAEAFYETLFAALNATKPDCVTFVDGAGGSGAIRYFMLAGTGGEARARVDEAFREVEFIVTLDIFDRGGRIQADLKLTDADGATVAAPPAFDLPDDFVATSCAAGAIPMNRAVRTAARSLLERAPDLAALIDGGGRFADTDETPGFTAYFSRLMVDALTEEASDVLSGRSVRLTDETALGGDGVYTFSYQYWPCGDGTATEVSAKLRKEDGQTASWRGKVRLDRVPGWIDIFPAGAAPEQAVDPGDVPADEPVVESDPEPAPADDPGPVASGDPRPQPQPVPRTELDPRPVPTPRAFYALSFTPRSAVVGDVVSIVADVAEGCEPVFLDLTEAGAGQVVPLDVFVVEPGTDNGTRYRVDTSTPVGLRITPEDTKGVHYVGYVCTADGSFPETDLLKEIHGGLAGGTLRRTDPAAGPVFWFERYEIR